MYDCTYNGSVDVEWDNEKASSNLSKHGIDFADAVTALYDEQAITVPDDREV